MRLTILLIAALFAADVPLYAAGDLDILPPADKALADTVDPWGQAFSDQLTRFKGHFAAAPEARFAVGYTHNLMKILPNKYWFRGEAVLTGKINAIAKPLWGVTGSTVSFQMAVLPKVGAAEADYTIKAEALLPTRIYREEFVNVGPAAYPRLASDTWPDPLIESTTCHPTGVAPGVLLVEVQVPADFNGKDLACRVEISDAAGQAVGLSVPIHVVKLAIHATAYPLLAQFGKGDLEEKCYQELMHLALENHLQPLDAPNLNEVWMKQGPEAFKKLIAARMKEGQEFFQIDMADQSLYKTLKDEGWLSHFLAYPGSDEPSDETFKSSNIPAMKEFRAKFPGVRAFLASQHHPHMEEGCDIWLTDLSTADYNPQATDIPAKPELWHYYCHIPINAQFRAPLLLAPNMMIDNPAMEHRVALWMSYYFGARGVFIWAGNLESPGKDFWKNVPLEIHQEKATYPYGGVHHGNGFLFYPPKDKGGHPIASLRLKVLRDAEEDIAIFAAVRQAHGGKAPAWLSPVPEVFVHPQYFDHLPETLLSKREAILRAVESGG